MISKKIVSLGLACALAVSPLSFNCAFANEPVAASKVSTTNNENSKSKVDEETLNKIVEKLKKANKEEMEALAEKLKKVNKEDLNNLLEQLAKEKTETKQLRSDLSKLKSKFIYYFLFFIFFAFTSNVLSVFKEVSFNPSSLFNISSVSNTVATIFGWFVAIAGLCIE